MGAWVPQSVKWIRRANRSGRRWTPGGRRDRRHPGGNLPGMPASSMSSHTSTVDPRLDGVIERLGPRRASIGKGASAPASRNATSSRGSNASAASRAASATEPLASTSPASPRGRCGKLDSPSGRTHPARSQSQRRSGVNRKRPLPARRLNQIQGGKFAEVPDHTVSGPSGDHSCCSNV
jgi:hypothetical protein